VGMERFSLRGEFVTLVQAMKVVGQVGSGGEGKVLIRGGVATVNGEVELRPGRKLRVGDTFGFELDSGSGPKKKEWRVEQGDKP